MLLDRGGMMGTLVFFSVLIWVPVKCVLACENPLHYKVMIISLLCTLLKCLYVDKRKQNKIKYGYIMTSNSKYSQTRALSKRHACCRPSGFS